jgi:hypothetical protein
MKERQSSEISVDRLIDAIMQKLKANREIVTKSLRHGRLVWRRPKDGEFEIDLELKL